MLEILDGIIATGAVVLALSLIVQAIQQIIKQALSLKSTYMRRELLALFGAVEAETLSKSISREIPRRLAGQPAFVRKTADFLLRGLPGFTWKLVDSIPNVLQPLGVQALRAGEKARLIVQGIEEKTKSFGYKDLEMLESADAKKLKEIVNGLLRFRDLKADDRSFEAAKKSAQKAEQDALRLKTKVAYEKAERAKERLGLIGDLRRALQDIDTWFDITKKAFQDHYERRMKYWAFGLSAVVVIVLNANIFEIYRDFATSKPLRQAAIALGEKLTAIPRDSIIVRTVEGKADTVTSAKAESLIRKEIEKNLTDIQALLNDNTYQFMRWNTARGDSLRFTEKLGGRFSTGVSDVFSALFRNLLGWLAMMLLVSLGAPFWYDLLKAMMEAKNKLRK